MSKTLRTIQITAKIGKIISKITEIFCIVGLVGCMIGIASMAVIGNSSYQLGGLTIHNIIEAKGVSTGTLYTIMSVSSILCLGEAILAGKAFRFFRNELEIGTPFDLEVADSLKSLAVMTMVLPLVFGLIADVLYKIMSMAMNDVADMHIDQFITGGVTIGVAMLIISFICRYGAECISQDNNR